MVYMDTEATYHIMPEYDILVEAMPYNGSAIVYIGDDLDLQITNFKNTYFQ